MAMEEIPRAKGSSLKAKKSKKIKPDPPMSFACPDLVSNIRKAL